MGKEYDGIHRTTFVIDENEVLKRFQMLKQRHMLRKF
jgi:peroxiredoxin